MALFSPPIHRTAAAVLNRALFSKTIALAAARVSDHKNISRYRAQLDKSRELLRLERQVSVRHDPDPALASKGGKCLLLTPEVKADDPTTWSTILQEAVKTNQLGVIPFNLQLDYDYWTYLDVMKAILPEESQEEIPVGFSIVGHVAHLNLRDQYLPYKYLIATVLLDKNPSVRTVINKVDTIDSTSSAYRTFNYEVLAGLDDMKVEMREEDCVFRFDYSKVYWNSRLNTEHKRLVGLFKPGELVADVMAGVGPFAVPAGKRGVFVWANDLNPNSYESLKDAISRNKVESFVRPFNQDGHKFIKHAADALLQMHNSGTNTITLAPKPSRSRQQPSSPSKALAPLEQQPITAVMQPTILHLPPTISHFVMNLPASAISFLPAFKGLYMGHERLFSPNTQTELPMVHVHCFSTKSDDNIREQKEICERISEMLGVTMRPANGENEAREVTIHDVRDVAPLKRMFCASFRLPVEVVFAKRETDQIADEVEKISIS